MTEQPKNPIEIDSLSHSYGQRPALIDLCLQVRQGEIFGILGPNGSGKTTLFRILSTLIPPTSGSVAILGMDIIQQRDQVRRQLGVVFQSPSLDKQLTAEENLRHHGHLYGLHGSQLNESIHRLLDRLGLSDRRHEKVERFSGGMRRRVELAKGMLTHPRVLLLDEPSTGIDPAARIELWKYLQEIRDNEGVTVLLTTHLMEEAERCVRLAIFDHGRMVACDTPASLKDRIGGDVITLRTDKLEEASRRIMDQFQQSSQIVDGALRLERPKAHEFIPQLIEALPGIVDSVSVGKPTIEDVFVHVTGHMFRDPV